MISYIFTVAVVNVAVGFLLAAYLGRRCRALTPASEPVPSPADLEEGHLPIPEQTGKLADAESPRRATHSTRPRSTSWTVKGKWFQQKSRRSPPVRSPPAGTATMPRPVAPLNISVEATPVEV